MRQPHPLPLWHEGCSGLMGSLPEHPAPEDGLYQKARKPLLFPAQSRDFRGFVHGDNFVLALTEADFQWFQ